MNFREELQKERQVAVNHVAKLVSNTVKAKVYYKEGGWSMVDEKLGDHYCNPNFSMMSATLGLKLRELGIKTDYIIKNLMDDVVKVVNYEFEFNVVSYKIDRLAHKIVIN